MPLPWNEVRHASRLASLRHFRTPKNVMQEFVHGHLHIDAPCAVKDAPYPAGESPARGNRLRPGAAKSCDRADASRYRVLREVLSRGSPRSVDRECAGRNASSVKVSSPVKHICSVVAEQVWSSEGSTDDPRAVGTRADRRLLGAWCCEETQNEEPYA